MLSCLWFIGTPWTEAYQALLSMGFSIEYWNGLPFPTPGDLPDLVSWKWKWQWNCSVLSDSLLPHERKPTRLLCPWDFPGKNTGVGCHSFSRGSSWARDWTRVFCIVGRRFILWATRGVLVSWTSWQIL